VGNSESFEDLLAVPKGAPIRNQGARRNRVKIIAYHVRENERDYRNSTEHPCKLAALQSGEMFADCIYLMNGRAGA